MSRLYTPNLQQPGDIVLNLGDPDYPLEPGDSLYGSLTPADLLCRILAYTLVAERIYVPSRYLLAGGPILGAVKIAPALLELELVVPSIHENEQSFEDLARHRRRGVLAEENGRWLDEHAPARQPFTVGPLSRLYKSQIIDDLSEDGPFWRMLDAYHRPGIRKRLITLKHRFESSEAGRGSLVELSASILPRYRNIFERWAAVRYYSTPALTDEVLLTRELPSSGYDLLLPKAANTDESEIGRQFFENELRLSLPRFVATPLPREAATVVNAVLETREQTAAFRRRAILERTLSSGQTSVSADLERELTEEARRRRRQRYAVATSVVLSLAGTGVATTLNPIASAGIGLGVLGATTAGTAAYNRFERSRQQWSFARETLRARLGKEKK